MDFEKTIKENTKKDVETFTDKMFTVIKVTLFIIIMWVNVTSVVCWVRNPHLSKMEITMRIPRSFILDFEINDIRK